MKLARCPATAVASVVVLFVVLHVEAATCASVAGAAERGPAAEALTFRLSVAGLRAGRARFATARTTGADGRALVSARGQAETLPWLAAQRTSSDYQVTIDPATLLPSRAQYREHGSGERRIVTVVEGHEVAVDVRGPREALGGRVRLPEVVREPVSALLALRAAPLHEGDVLSLLVVQGTTLVQARFGVRRGAEVQLEEVATGAGRGLWRAIRLDGQYQELNSRGQPNGVAPRRVTLWLSEDAARIPLRVESDTDLGRAVLELTSYAPSEAPASYRAAQVAPPAAPSTSGGPASPLPGVAIEPATVN